MTSTTSTPKLIHFSDHARHSLLKGVNILANAVASTLGPSGRNIILPGPHPSATPLTTKDGVTVAKSIDLADPAQQAGVLLLRSVASKTVDIAGDGTTTAVVLARAIYTAGLKLVASGLNPTSIKRGVDRAATLITHILSSLSSPVSGPMIAQVGSISSNGDAEIGSILALAMERVGPSGVVTVEESKSLDTTLEIVEGMQFDRGYLSPYFVTDPARMEACYEHIEGQADTGIAVLLFARKLSSSITTNELAQFLAQHLHKPHPRRLLILAEDIETDVMTFLIVNKVRAALPVVAVRSPGFGDQRTALLHDIAALTGATVIGDEFGVTLKNATGEVFGSARRITVDKDSTTISCDGANSQALMERIDDLRSQLARTESSYDRVKLEERLAKLTGGVAVVRVGAPTETEMKEKKDRVEDAMYATRAAVAEGIVPGGGVALLRAVHSEEFISALFSCTDTEECAGMRILQQACEAPLRQIVHNAGGNDSDVISGVLHPERHSFIGNTMHFGYNAATRQFEDLVAAGVIDPTKVTRTALQSAASIAGLMLTTEAVVVDDQVALKELAQMRGGQQQLPAMY